jgi:hypothetical protein
MTDEQGRPTVSTYYDTQGMTPEDVEAKDQQILAVAGPWRSLQFRHQSQVHMVSRNLGRSVRATRTPEASRFRRY